MTTKLTGLSVANVNALGETSEALGLVMYLTSTTATFEHSPAEVVAALDRTIASLPNRGHPRASLYAVRRKAGRQV